MPRSTLPGTVQVRVIADASVTEKISVTLTKALESIDLQVIDCTTDYIDRYDPNRRKFYLIAIPTQKEGEK